MVCRGSSMGMTGTGSPGIGMSDRDEMDADVRRRGNACRRALKRNGKDCRAGRSGKIGVELASPRLSYGIETGAAGPDSGRSG